MIHRGFEGAGRAVLNQIGQVLDELRGTLPSEVVALRESENFLELVEDQQRDERLAGRIAQDVVAVVQEFPERFATDGDTRLRPSAGRLRRPEDGALDLLGRCRRVARIVDAHIHRAIALGPQPRHDPRAQDGSLTESRLSEEDGEQLALHAAAEFGDLLLAPVEVLSGFLGEGREAKPGVVGIDGWLGRGGRGGRPVVAIVRASGRGLVRVTLHRIYRPGEDDVS